MGRRAWKRFGRARRARMPTAWYDFSLPLTTQSGSSDGMTILCGANSLVPLSSTGLDWGRKEWLRLLRFIGRLLIVLTSTGSEQYVKILWGVRITELDQDGSLRTTADNPSLVNADDDSRRVDWLWRSSTVCLLPATSGTEVVPELGAENPLSMDFKPNRDFPPNAGVVFHLRTVLLGTSATNSDAAVSADLDGRLLLGRRRAI